MNYRIFRRVFLRTYLTVFGIMALTWSVTSCGLTTHHRLYTGPNLPANEIAVLKGSEPIILYQVDENPGPNFGGLFARNRYNSKLDGRFVVELLPGTHKLVVAYLYIIGREPAELLYIDPKTGVPFFTTGALKYQMYPDKILILDAKPGRTYEIKITGFAEGDNWSATILEVK